MELSAPPHKIRGRHLSQHDLTEILYREPICLLETFVKTGRFQGTCHRDGNWAMVGETTGRGKYERHYQRSESVKAVFFQGGLN